MIIKAKGKFVENLLLWIFFAMLLFILCKVFLSQDETKHLVEFADEMTSRYAIKVAAFAVLLAYALIIRLGLFRSNHAAQIDNQPRNIEMTTMRTQHQPNAAMKIAIAAFAVLLTASPGHSKEAAPLQHKVVFLEGISSSCFLGDECPDLQPDEKLNAGLRVLPALLSLGWRVVSITPVNKEGGFDHSVAIPCAYVLLEK